MEWAVINDNLDMVQTLVASGAYVNVKDLDQFMKTRVDETGTEDYIR